MKELNKILTDLFSTRKTLAECHMLHIEILDVLNQIDDNRRKEILSEKEDE